MPGTLQTLADNLARRAGVERAPRSAVVAAVVLSLMLFGWALWRWWPAADSASGVLEEVPAGAPSVETPTETAVATLVVHVTGAVRRAGVYELSTGTRVSDLVDAAGGLLPDAAPEGVNLARLLTDGEQVHIPDEDEMEMGAVGPAPVPNAAAPPTSALVNINTADAAGLDALPGVGPSTAEKIITDRETNGPFASVEDLGRVSGIGPKKLEELRDLVCVN